MFTVFYLPNFSLQAVLRHRPDETGPAAVLIGNADDAKPAIAQLNAAALDAGVQAGMTSSQGLARCERLRIFPRSPSEESTLAAALLETAFSCSPWVEQTADGVCTYERHNVPLAELETLAQRALAHLTKLELKAQAGIGSTPDLAWLAAQTAAPLRTVRDSRAFLRDLPVSVLNPSFELADILRQWGVTTLGALNALPLEGLTHRLGPEGRALHERAAGRQTRLLRLAAAPEIFEESMEFDYEVQTLEPLLFVLRRFIEALVARLAIGYRVPAALTLRLEFEDGPEYRRHFRIPAPTDNPEILFRVIHTHLEDFKAPAAVRGLHLAAEPALPPHEQFGLFETALRDPNRFSETLARLHALLGAENAGVICKEDTHRPDAFHLEMPDFLHASEFAEDNAQKKPLAWGLPLRRLRPPAPLTIEEGGGAFPARIFCAQVRGEICAARGPFRFIGGWWDQDGWACEEWDVEMDGGELCRIARRRDGWALEGMYD